MNYKREKLLAAMGRFIHDAAMDESLNRPETHQSLREVHAQAAVILENALPRKPTDRLIWEYDAKRGNRWIAASEICGPGPFTHDWQKGYVVEKSARGEWQLNHPWSDPLAPRFPRIQPKWYVTMQEAMEEAERMERQNTPFPLLDGWEKTESCGGETFRKQGYVIWKPFVVMDAAPCTLCRPDGALILTSKNFYNLVESAEELIGMERTTYEPFPYNGWKVTFVSKHGQVVEKKGWTIWVPTDRKKYELRSPGGGLFREYDNLEDLRLYAEKLMDMGTFR